MAVLSFAANRDASGSIHRRSEPPGSAPQDGVSDADRPRPAAPGTSLSDPDTPHSS